VFTARYVLHSGGLPPEVTSQSRDVNKHGGGVNDV